MIALTDLSGRHGSSRFRDTVAYALDLCIIGIAYFILAKGGLILASINPSATPIWPATGLALAAVLIRGYRVWPAILVAAFAANVTTAGSVATSIAIGVGNTLEGVLGAWLVNRWSNGRDSFATPMGIARFCLLSVIPTALCATIGVDSLALAGFAEWSKFGSIWLTWWLGDLSGALVITPVVLFWAAAGRSSFRRPELIDSLALFAGTCAIGVIAFSPLVEQSAQRAPLVLLAIVPLLWAALRRGQRDTATVALILSCFAVWATLASSGPFGPAPLNDAFLMLLMFMISVAVPSLVLSADVAVRKRTEDELRRTEDRLNQEVEARTAALSATNRALLNEVEHRKRVEVELDQQRQHLVEAQRLAKLGSWVRDIESDTATWSEQLCEIYGMKPGEFTGTFQDFVAMVHPDDRERVQREFAEARKSGQGFLAERRILRPSGEVRYLQIQVEVAKDETGRVARMLGICRDVTEQREAENALERTREQLTQMQKMEALGQLTGGIAHDFNNLLMIVSGHAEMLRRRVTEPKPLQGIDAILAAARRGENLTRQLLTFSRRQPVNAVPVNLRTQIEAMRAMLGSSLRGNISFVVDIPGDLWPVKVDVAELELALVNIAVNARDAMPHGGTFTVSARNISASAELRGAHPGDDHVGLALSDNGSGIARDVIKKIFDPFFTTKAVGKGTGLGLSQVYGFANQSGGSVAVKSEVGRGTTIALTLPRSHAAVAANLETVDPHSSRRAQGTILLVEDNAEVRDVTATLLEQIGYRVLRAENAEDALAQLQRGPLVDLVFSDIVMPNSMNGIHLAQEVSERYPNLGVLLTTGYSEVTAAAETRFAVLRKPFELRDLERAVREAMSRAGGPVPRRAGGASM
jgi:PAS domain S-box-containing protein